MSAAVSTSRATSRTSRDKSKITAQHSQTKTDGPAAKVKPTAEQLRIAQITSGEDDSDLASRQQLMEMTGKDEDTVALALHDCNHDIELAALKLLEGQDEQGEWKEQGKKKKKPNPSASVSKSDSTSNHVSDRTDNKREHSRDVDSSDRSEKHDRNEHPPRRGRRNGGPPPRLARGRGRDRNNVFGDRNENVENGGIRENDREDGGFGDQKWDTFRERENGFGGRERSGERGRGRGRGKFGARGRGRGGGSGGPPSGGGGFGRNAQRFDKGPHIDTWTNETAAIADKEPDGFGETWTASEDWNDDSWQGELSETKVFTASSIKAQEQETISTLTMTNDLLGQSGSLGQTSALGQRLDINRMLPKSSESASTDSFIAQYNQQATESIKNTIGIGSSQRSNLGNLSNQTSANALNSFSQNLPQGSRMTAQSFSQGMSTQGLTSEVLSSHGLPLQNLSSQALSQSLSSQGLTSQGLSAQSLTSPTMQSQGLSTQHLMSQGHLQQRPKSQRSKLPPPSKIPASAVEMPGHSMPQLDVQFGVDFGTESPSFSFGTSDSIPQNSYSNSVPSSTQSSGMSNHIGQQTPSKSPESMITSSMISSPPGSKQQQLNLDQASPRNVFQKSAYTTPPRNETESPLNHSNKLAQADPIPFPPSQSDRKSSPLVGPQTGAALSQVSLSSTTSETSSLSSFGQSSGSYPSTGTFQSHKPSGLPVSQSYTHTTSTHLQQSSFPSQYQTSQNQYQSGQSQFQTGQSQFPSGSNQYQNYGPSGPSFQSQSSYTSSQTNPNTLYQSSTPTSTYQSQTGSSFVRDSQSSSQRPSSTGQSASASSFSSQTSSSSFQNPTNPSFPSQANSSSYGHQSNGTPFSNQSSSAYPNQSAASYSNQSGSASSYPSQTSGSFSNQSSGSYSNQPSSSSYQESSLSTQSAAGAQSQTGFSSQTFASSGHQSNLQASPLTANKISDSLSKMTLKDSIPDSQTTQFDHSTSSSTSTSLTTTTATSSLSTGTTTVSSSVTSVLSSTSRSSLPTTTKAPPNLPPGVPVIGAHQYIMNQGSMPPFYVSNPSNLQQPLYSYEDMLLQQQRMPPLASSYYDMTAFPVPSTIAGRDQATLASVPYSVGTTDSSKLNRVEAQSPNPTSQQQSTHSGQQQPYINLHYGYYYPSMLPGAAPGFQYPQMFPMPPVTNAPHGGTTATTQFQKTYPSHGYNTAKGYEDLTQTPDFSKSPYGISGSQSKASAGSRSATTADLAGTYGKSHAQPFDKQAFHAGTPPPFNLPIATATQAGAMGAATFGAPFVPMMPHQPHSQMIHHALQQDSTGASSRVSQQATSQAKVASKAYPSYGWSS